MKLRNTILAVATTAALTIQAQNDWTDVTKTYIQDPDFENCEAVTADVSTTANSKGASYTEQGWTCQTIIHDRETWSNSAVFAYGSGKKLNKVEFPTSDKRQEQHKIESNTKGLGITIGRKTELIYQTNEITLPAGHYVLSVWGRNFNSSKATPFNSQLGFVSGNMSYKSTKTAFTAWSWEEDKVEFTLAEEATGRIQLGGIATEKSGGEHAIMAFDHLCLLYQPITAKEKMEALLAEASLLTIPTSNVGDAPFQFPSAAIEAFTQAVSNAQAKYDADNVTADDITSFSEAVIIYRNKKDELNPPAEGTTYKMQLAYNWPEESKFSYLNSGFVTLNNILSNQGGYNLSIGTSDARFSDEPYLAQQFTLTPVDGVQNGYTISLIDKEGNNRYLCAGSIVGGNNSQIRTTTSQEDALTIVVQYSGMNDEKATFRFISTLAPSGTFIGFDDQNSYCWSSSCPANVFYLHEKTSNDLPCINLNIGEGQYATCMLPFVRTAEGELISNLFNGKVNVYSCSNLTGDGTRLELQPIEGELTAHVPYILKATVETKLELKGYGTAYNTTTEYTSGLLTGTYANTGYFPEGSYVLQTQNGRQAFYFIDTTRPIAKSPYHAYLSTSTMPAGVKSIGFAIEDDEATNIQGVNSTESHITNIYNINGIQQLHLQKGMNIIHMSNGNVVKKLK